MTMLRADPIASVSSMILSIFWMWLIYHLSSLPASSTGPDTLLFKILSKISHFILFGILSILFLFGFKWKKPLKDTGINIFVISFLLTTTYAVTDEFHQLFSHGRQGRAADVLLDSSGALAFLAITYWLSRKKWSLTSPKRGVKSH